jgi:hypothetical protein
VALPAQPASVSSPRLTILSAAPVPVQSHPHGPTGPPTMLELTGQGDGETATILRAAVAAAERVLPGLSHPRPRQQPLQRSARL